MSIIDVNSITLKVCGINRSRKYHQVSTKEERTPEDPETKDASARYTKKQQA